MTLWQVLLCSRRQDVQDVQDVHCVPAPPAYDVCVLQELQRSALSAM